MERDDKGKFVKINDKCRICNGKYYAKRLCSNHYNSLYHNKYDQEHKEELAIKKKKHYEENRERILSQQRKSRKKNPERYRNSVQKYYEKNKEKLRPMRRLWMEKERRKNPKYKLNGIISNAILKALKGRKNGRSWENLVGYTLQDLMNHLEKQFDKTMSWNNYGSYWHIDHISPVSWFKYETATDKGFKSCWKLSNLRPLEKYENLKKQNSLVLL